MDQVGQQLDEIVLSSLADAWSWRVGCRDKFSTMRGTRPGPSSLSQGVNQSCGLKKNQGLDWHRKQVRERISNETIRKRNCKEVLMACGFLYRKFNYLLVSGTLYIPKIYRRSQKAFIYVLVCIDICIIEIKIRKWKNLSHLNF